MTSPSIDSTIPGAAPLLRGTVTRRVTSYGANWGIVTAHGTSRKTFFNKHSYADQAYAEGLPAGSEVEFEEETDPVNGTHAVNLRPVSEGPAENS